MTRICDIAQDTQCAPCPGGTFNSKPTKDSTCQQCKTCPEDYYIWTPCISVADTVCESCKLKPSGSGNEDYLTKCERTTTPTKPPTLYPSSTSAGGNGDKGDDLDSFLTKGQALTAPQDGDGSGEGSGETVPVMDTRTLFSPSLLPTLGKCFHC